MSGKSFLTDIFINSAASCHPQVALKKALPKSKPIGRTLVLGAGKAAVEMASVAAMELQGEISGLVVTRYGYGNNLDTGSIDVIYAGHPVPDKSSVEAAQSLLALAAQAGVDDRVIFLISGGGSALLACPAGNISFDEKQRISRDLVLSGAPVTDINLVRRHLSLVKGGGLAAAASPAELMSFIISDVVGDKPEDIASAPSVFVKADPQAALDVLDKHNIVISDLVHSAITKKNDVEPFKSDTHVVAKAGTALEEASRQLVAAGWSTIILGDAFDGDAAKLGESHARLLSSYQEKGTPYALISGGELTVSVNNHKGRGGPNLEYLAAFLLHLNVNCWVEAIACDSDGIDGSEDNAGAYLSSQSLRSVSDLGLDIQQYLDSNNTYELFKLLGDLIITGPTGTNVNDIRIILIDPSKSD